MLRYGFLPVSRDAVLLPARMGGQQKRAWQQFSQMGKLPYVFPDMSIFRFIQYLLVFSRRLIRMLSLTQPDD